MRLHSLEIPVQDMSRACSFYADVLGFPAVTRRGDETAIFFLGDVHGGMVSLVRTEGAAADGTAFVLEVDEDIANVRARLEKRGARFVGPTEERPSGRIAYLRDTEGNRLAISERRWPPRLRRFADLPRRDIAAELETLEARTRELLGEMSEEDAGRHPAPGEWTAIDHLGHIIDSLDSCGELATELAHGRMPVVGGLWQPDYPASSLVVALEESGRAFGEAHDWLARLPASPDLRATAPHGVFGRLNCREWVAFMLFHVELHLTQIEALKAAIAR